MTEAARLLGHGLTFALLRNCYGFRLLLFKEITEMALSWKRGPDKRVVYIHSIIAKRMANGPLAS